MWWPKIRGGEKRELETEMLSAIVVEKNAIFYMGWVSISRFLLAFYPLNIGESELSLQKPQRAFKKGPVGEEPEACTQPAYLRLVIPTLVCNKQ